MNRLSDVERPEAGGIISFEVSLRWIDFEVLPAELAGDVNPPPPCDLRHEAGTAVFKPRAS